MGNATQRNATQLAFVCLILGFSLETLAQCKQISGATNYSKFDEFGQPARKIHYFIESDFHTELRNKTAATDDDTLTQAQMVRAIQEAAETWNNEALGQQLVYGGLVSVENPDQICTATTKRPVVFVNFKDSHLTASATVSKVQACDKAAALTVFGETNGTIKNWGIGSQGVLSDRLGLYGTLVHEFGHALEIGHGHELSPPNCHGIMSYRTVPACQGRPGVRHLRGYDQECSTAFQNPRRAKYYTTRFNSAGTLISPPAFLPTVGGQPLRTDRGFYSAGLSNPAIMPRYLLWGERIGQSAMVWWTPVDTNGYFSWWLISYFQPPWYTNFHTTPTFASAPEISAARTTFNHPYYFYPSDYGQPVQRWGLTSDDFSTITYGYGANFVRCSDISCSTSVPIRGFLPITSGYNPKTNTTMVIETRTQDSPSHTEIWVYPGFYNNYYAALLPGTKFSGSASQMDFPASGASWTYNARPHRSAVTACSDHTFEREFNCMLAWAEPGKSDGRILYSFYKHMPGQTPAIQFHLVDGKRKVYSRGSSDTVTTPGIAFFAGRYWLAFKQADATNTIAWSTFSSSGWSATATINASSHGFLADPPSFGYQHNKEAVMSWTVVE